MSQTDAMKDVNECATKAVAHHWQNQAVQRQKQVTTGRTDQGAYDWILGELAANRSPGGLHKGTLCSPPATAG